MREVGERDIKEIMEKEGMREKEGGKKGEDRGAG